MIISSADSTNSHPRRHLFIRAIGRFLAGLGLLFVMVTVTPVDIWWVRALAGPLQPASGKVLIVLGGTVNDYGTVGGSSYWRCVYAAHHFRDGGFQQVVVSGGQIEGSSVSGAMADFLVCLGVPRAAISAEARSENTRENALYTKELLGNDSRPMVLVTSDYHMFRASRCFRKVGLNVLTFPNPDVAMRAKHWRGRWPAFLDLVQESVKIAYYFVRGWI
jgi:uncharacterized SAM-binding protein YcdF (DUF218 family)